MLAAFFRLAYAAINAANVTLHFAPLLVLTGQPASQQSLAVTFTQLHLLGFDVALIFFGVHVTLATGRMFAATLPFARQLNIRAPLICYQGALIRHPLEGRHP